MQTLSARARSSRPGAGFSRGIVRTSRSKSRRSVRCAARAATRTATSISAATSRCAAVRLQGRRAGRRFMAMIDRHRPLHVSIVGGEPLVRYRELGKILPQLAERDIHTQLVTSAVRPIPIGVGRAAAPADGGVDRRTAARARCAAHAGHLRPHPEAHRRTPDHRALHRDPAAGAPRRISRGVPDVLAAESAHPPDLDQPVYAAGGRDLDGAADEGRPRAGHRRPAAAAHARSRSCRCSTAC